MHLRHIPVFLILCLFFTSAGAQSLQIRLATVVPKDSTWHTLLQEMGEKWRQAWGGKVQLRIYAGTQGDEPDIIRRMRIGQLHAAAVSTAGLGSIDAASQALHIPLAFSSYEELDYVQEHISARVEKALLAKGFVVLNWGDAGWVRFFTKTPVQYPADMKKLKLFVWATDSTTADMWKDAGFQTLPLASTDILPALQTGMISALPVPPLVALTNQWFALTRHMTDLKWAPLTGATIITKEAWEKIPADARPALAQIAREIGEKMKKEVRRLEQEAIQAMVKRGLKIVPVPPDALKEWQTLTEEVYPRIRREMIPPEYFDEVLKLRDEFRASQAAIKASLP